MISKALLKWGHGKLTKLDENGGFRAFTQSMNQNIITFLLRRFDDDLQIVNSATPKEKEIKILN